MMNRTPTALCVCFLILPTVLALSLAGGAGGCGSKEEKDRDFFTSGSRDADQRAEQRVAQVEQLRGESGDDEEKGKGDEKPAGLGGAGGDATVKKTLYERLGGEEGIALIVEDFVNRALADPRVNWTRKGVKTGGFVGIGDRTVEWSPTPENGTKLKKHMAQFIAVATGGPATYEGRDMKGVHAGMKITNAEFDATIGDLKATLDKLGVPTEEQKELLAIIETTRPQIAEKR